jgi:hypothetical protein
MSNTFLNIEVRNYFIDKEYKENSIAMPTISLKIQKTELT